MTEERYVAAIEISSSKIIGAVGRYAGDGELEVIGIEQEKGVDAVRYGIIQNLEETALRAARVIDKLEHKPGIAPRKISRIFAGLSGRSLRGITSEAALQLPAETEINDEILSRLKQQATNNIGIDSRLKIIDVIPRTYFVGNKHETSSPKGSVGNSIRGIYDIIVCRPELEKNLTRVLDSKLNKKFDEIVVPVACGHLILTPDEKRLGCILVDMGAETTTVTIYVKANLSYFATIPLGGRNITRDLQTLSMLEERAEEMKKTSGNAIASDNVQSININGLKHSDVSNLVVARAEEIVANIIEQISYAGLTEKDLPGGIIVIGGGSRLNGMLDLLQEKSGLSVRKGQLPEYVILENTKVHSADAIEVISVLYAGATQSDISCLESPVDMPVTGRPNLPEEEEQEPEPKERKQKSRGRSFMSKIQGSISRLFAPPEDDDDDSELM